jgi:hypothetical protein
MEIKIEDRVVGGVSVELSCELLGSRKRNAQLSVGEDKPG